MLMSNTVMLKSFNRANSNIIRRKIATFITFNNHAVCINCSLITNLDHLEYVDYKNSLLIQQRLHYHSKQINKNPKIADEYVIKEEEIQPSQHSRLKHQQYEINKKISNAENCHEIFSLIEYALDKNSGGGLLDHVCFATSVNRLARHLTRNRMERNVILSEKRFSLLFACLAEALVSEIIVIGDSSNHNSNNVKIRFGTRAMANIGWAIAKLRITLPASKLPLLQTSLQQKESNNSHIMLCEASETLLATAQRLRESIAINTTNIDDEKHTILPNDSELSTLTSQMLDYIGILVSTRIKNATILGENNCTTKMPNLQECSNLHWAWATARRADSKVFDIGAVLMNTQVRELLESGSIDTLHPQTLSNSLWAMATANLYGGPQLVEFLELAAHLMQNEKQFLKKYNSQDLSNSAWAISKLVTDQHGFWKQNELIDGDPSGLDLTNRMNQSALTIIHIVAMEVIQTKAVGFNTQVLSNIAWAFATVASTDIILIRNATNLIIQESIRTLPDFNGRNGSTLVWAVAQVFESKSYIIDNLFQRVGNKLLERTIQVHPQHLSMTLVGFAKLKFTDDSLYRSLASRLFTDKAAHLTSQHISNVMWALATAGVDVQYDRLPTIELPSQSSSETTTYNATSTDPVLRCCAAAANEFIRRPHEFNTQDITNLCWGLATLGIKDTTFLKKVEDEIKTRLGSVQLGKSHGLAAFTGQAVANILWSFAILNYVDGNLLRYFEPYILKMCKDETCQTIRMERIANFFHRQSLGIIARACAAFGKFPDELMKILYHGQFGSGSLEDGLRASKLYCDGGLGFQAVRALVQTQTAMQLAKSKNSLSLPSNFPEAWMQRDGSTLSETSQLGWTVSTSKLQKDVSKSLKSIGFNHEMEHCISMKDLANDYGINVPGKDVNIFSIDIASVEKKIAIEVDGPTHFLYTIDSNMILKTGKSYSNTGNIMYEANGSTMLKRRLLTSMGWTVLTVPYWEWRLLNDDHQKEQYCHRLVVNA